MQLAYLTGITDLFHMKHCPLYCTVFSPQDVRVAVIPNG